MLKEKRRIRRIEDYSTTYRRSEPDSSLVRPPSLDESLSEDEANLHKKKKRKGKKISYTSGRRVGREEDREGEGGAKGR